MYRSSAAILPAILIAYVLPDGVVGQVPIPNDLRPGDKYHLIFNSSTFTTATSTNMDVYNAQAQDAADAAGIGSSLGVTWKAIASTTMIDARDNAVVRTVTPVYNMNLSLGLELVASGYSDMWDGTLNAPLAWNEYGRSNSGDAWTGSLIDGTAAPGLALGSANGLAWCGSPIATNSSWINFITPSLTLPLHVFALSEELIVPLFGDFNDDDRVNAADYTVWRDNVGTTKALPNDPTPGSVTSDDYTVWRSNYGTNGLTVSSSHGPVPEPTAITLVGAAVVIAWLGRPPGAE